MHNKSVEQLLNECFSDLENARAIIISLGSTSNVVPYLNKYSVIRACGTIEVAFKSIITDFCAYRSKQQIKNYINGKIKDGSMNPSYTNICGLLKMFDSTWNSSFKSAMDIHPDKTKILTGVQSLVDSRNEFAHGGNPSTSISDTIKYFIEARKMIELLDSIIT
jgi:hypothetical protein